MGIVNNSLLGKELIVRKNVASYLETILEFCGYEFRHDHFKEIIYSEKECRIPLDYLMKNYFDAFNYLLNNHKTPFTTELLRKFFYIMNFNEVDFNFLKCLVSKFFFMNHLPPVDKALEFHLYAYQEMKEFEDNEKFIISMLFLNYILVREGIPCIQIKTKDLKMYVEYKEEFYKGKSEKIYSLIVEIITQMKFQDKSYYLKLRTLDSNEIFQTLYQNQKMLKDEYKVKSIYIFGTFATGKQRIDSDIDLIISFCEDLSYEEKQEKIKNLSNYYLNVFHRFIDCTEANPYLDDHFITVMTNAIKVF